jgi:hypothetical protein
LAVRARTGEILSNWKGRKENPVECIIKTISLPAFPVHLRHLKNGNFLTWNSA